MRTKSITFNTKGYDGFIDFIKAYAILCVLFGHTFCPYLDKVAYGVWAGMQVPLFILVQTFHALKKDKVTVSLARIFKRVLLPFFILEVITFVIALCVGRYDLHTLFRMSLGGGFGPGAYFPWVYVQIAILLPLFAYLLNNCGKVLSLIVFLLICEGSELLFSYIGIPENLYRLLAMRYVFLIYLGWLWVREGIIINWLTILLSLISLGAIIYFEYFSINDEPWFFTTGFSYHRWPCYFFVAYGFSMILNIMWKLLCKSKIIRQGVNKLSASSYEIFLIQMSLIFLVQSDSLWFISSEIVRYSAWVIFIWFLSVFGGILLNKVLNSQRQSMVGKK